MLASHDDSETDNGPGSTRTELGRLCLATREVTPLDAMIRFVVAPDGAVIPDLARKLPGRGAWLTGTRAAFDTALRRKAFGRAFRGKGKAGPELATLIDQLLERDTMSALALANKAGAVITGTTKVTAALAEGKVAALLHAADASADGTQKLDGTARRIAFEFGENVETVSCFPGAQLDLALGRSNVVHAALLAHPTSAGFLARCRKLERWRAE